MFYYLVYASYATHPLSQRGLEELLATSRDNNKAHDVTGMLLYIDGKFLQVLEGPKDSVRKIFGAIRKDVRHKKISVIIEGHIKKRNFDAWHMSFKSFTASRFEKLSGFRDIEAFFLNNPVSRDSHVAHVFLQLFFNKHYKPFALS